MNHPFARQQSRSAVPMVTHPTGPALHFAQRPATPDCSAETGKLKIDICRLKAILKKLFYI
ncbi:hypothetical protein ASD85_08170 [Rhizobium sp. Root651]|nr:hypothetical protein ASD85_08170 [Rhizobium sp. Root651]